MKGRVLVIDDEKPVCISCKRILEEDGHVVEYQTSGVQGVKKAVRGDFEVVLLDLKIPDLPGMAALEQILKLQPDIRVIIITGYATIQTSIEAIKKGAFDYIPKPFTPGELSVSVSKALNDRNLHLENQYLKQELFRLKQGTNIIGRSKAMENIMNQIVKIAPSDFTVMIYGESGTGKELIARAVHENSGRSEKPFVAVDVSSLSPTLIESELFGHIKGAFTGATQDRPGYFSIANGGTLFLDEISNISLELQGKLLRVLETKLVRQVGSEQELNVDVRIIAASNKNLYELVESEKFREDLYYRLAVIPINIPPLRERSDDIPVLAMHFLQTAAGIAESRIKGFTTQAMAKLMSYRWPGNVRELKNIIERLIATVDVENIDVKHLPTDILDDMHGLANVDIKAIPRSLNELKETKRTLKDKVYREVEKSFVLEALKRNGWNVTHAAKEVGMLRPNFHALMRKYGIQTRK